MLYRAIRGVNELKVGYVICGWPLTAAAVNSQLTTTYTIHTAHQHPPALQLAQRRQQFGGLRLRERAVRSRLNRRLLESQASNRRAELLCCRSLPLPGGNLAWPAPRQPLVRAWSGVAWRGVAWRGRGRERLAPSTGTIISSLI